MRKLKTIQRVVYRKGSSKQLKALLRLFDMLDSLEVVKVLEFLDVRSLEGQMYWGAT